MNFFFVQPLVLPALSVALMNTVFVPEAAKIFEESLVFVILAKVIFELQFVKPVTVCGADSGSALLDSLSPSLNAICTEAIPEVTIFSASSEELPTNTKLGFSVSVLVGIVMSSYNV